MPDKTDICAVIPTYQNGGTVTDVIRRTVPHVARIIVVDDGSTDDTATKLERLKADGTDFLLLTHSVNRGKGAALQTGLGCARQAGFRYAVTIDADGQHLPEEIPRLVAALDGRPDSLIVGSRGLKQANMPGANTFANRFSNFWFSVQTLRRLPDTQSGYRIYPLRRLAGLKYITRRYEAELELLVLAAWHGITITPVAVSVYYPAPEERVTHFRPLRDFGRISLLNTLLCLLVPLYALPLYIIRKAKRLFTPETSCRNTSARP